MSWERFTQLANDWLPKPRILHPWPERRFAVKHSRWEPYGTEPYGPNSGTMPKTLCLRCDDRGALAIPKADGLPSLL